VLTVRVFAVKVMKLTELGEPFTQIMGNSVELVVDTWILILLDVLVVDKEYLESLEDTEETDHLCVKYPKCIRIIMVAKTIHITEAQAEWLDDNAYNVSRLCRKVLAKIMNDEIAKEFFIKNKTKSQWLNSCAW